ncbi:SDR family NAD(P)-dependent oxidoreductase [Cardiobacteriaceae bacterium TAE3-ERU3]|nr:SDR family NAD(P)-dependent oxidoreductase [Cardiobacteriaceae bacterium TAE3-ERU3]
MNTPVWFITGASKGLGLALARVLLAQNYRVVATSRDQHKLAQVLGEKSGQFLPLQMQVTDHDSIKNAVAQVQAHFGSIDVLVNNAGFGVLGNLEELPWSTIEDGFEVNVFGVMRMLRTVLPVMRAQKRGHIFNIASVSATVSAPAGAVYSATKAAVLQLSEGLAAELKPLGIHVTAICPGGFRTDFLDPSSMQSSAGAIDDYVHVHDILAQVSAMNHQQRGNPDKLAEALITLSHSDAPPLRMYFGSDAQKMVDNKFERISKERDAYKALTLGTDFDR